MKYRKSCILECKVFDIKTRTLVTHTVKYIMSQRRLQVTTQSHNIPTATIKSTLISNFQFVAKHQTHTKSPTPSVDLVKNTLHFNILLLYLNTFLASDDIQWSSQFPQPNTILCWKSLLKKTNDASSCQKFFTHFEMYVKPKLSDFKKIVEFTHCKYQLYYLRGISS